jgi:hypothetical protein
MRFIEGAFADGSYGVANDLPDTPGTFETDVVPHGEPSWEQRYGSVGAAENLTRVGQALSNSERRRDSSDYGRHKSDQSPHSIIPWQATVSSSRMVASNIDFGRFGPSVMLDACVALAASASACPTRRTISPSITVCRQPSLVLRVPSQLHLQRLPAVSIASVSSHRVQ